MRQIAAGHIFEHLGPGFCVRAGTAPNEHVHCVHHLVAHFHVFAKQADVRRGVIPAEDEPRMRADGERAVRRILDREPPFDLDWTTWRPDPTWPIPVLPDGWDRV